VEVFCACEPCVAPICCDIAYRRELDLFLLYTPVYFKASRVSYATCTPWNACLKAMRLLRTFLFSFLSFVLAAVFFNVRIGPLPVMEFFKLLVCCSPDLIDQKTNIKLFFFGGSPHSFPNYTGLHCEQTIDSFLAWLVLLQELSKHIVSFSFVFSTYSSANIDLSSSYSSLQYSIHLLRGLLSCSFHLFNRPLFIHCSSTFYSACYSPPPPESYTSSVRIFIPILFPQSSCFSSGVLCACAVKRLIWSPNLSTDRIL